VTPRKKKPPHERPPVKITDARSIRALAHPARLAVIEELYSGGRELTATECAALVGLSPSAMSYHLRSLEKAGIVERAESSGDGRERPWRAMGSYLQVDSTTSGAGEMAAGAALSTTALGRTVEQFNAYLANRGAEPAEWLAAAEASYGQVWLLPDEAKAIGEDFVKLFEKYRGRRKDPPEGARRVRLALLLFPTDKPSRGT
jgi:DNA-binding transcriptional ArsR family regulator